MYYYLTASLHYWKSKHKHQTRWLYCVEYPQYSTRLEALSYLCHCL